MGSRDARNVDETLRALRKTGRYQVLQMVVICFGLIGAAYQRLGNVFIGRHVTSFQCAEPENDTLADTQLHPHIWNYSHVTYGRCGITVSSDNISADFERYPCMYGYDYEFRRELSFKTEFDLVCDRKLLVGLSQTILFLGQGVGALVASAFSDRFGRKKVLVVSQFALLIFGVAAGFAPSYPVLAFLKFLLGAFQQGVVTSSSTLSLELFPAETRSITFLLGPTAFGVCNASMALLAFLLQDFSWRYLQFAFSAVSVSALLQWWYLDDSLRWLVANGRKKAALTVLQRAARVNRVDLQHVINTLEASPTHTEMETLTTGDQQEGERPTHVASTPVDNTELVHTPEEKQTKKLTLLDLFGHRRLLCNAFVMLSAWFTCSLSFFGLYLMSTSLHGNRFLNFFLTSLMELPPGIFIFFMVDRIGRKWVTRPMFAVAGLGLVCSGIFRQYADNSVLQTLSVASAMLGMVGASGMFNAIFFYTQELFPTNIRSQTLGMGSLAGRSGAMLSPFMTDLADIAVWAPGALIGSLSFLVLFVMHFLPETKGRELPTTIEDIELWYQKKGENSDESCGEPK